jgi:hypothetical protein
MKWERDFHFLIVAPLTQRCIQECGVDPWSVRGRSTKMKWTRDFHFLIVVTPLTQMCIQECGVDPWSVRGGSRHTKFDKDPTKYVLWYEL